MCIASDCGASRSTLLNSAGTLRTGAFDGSSVFGWAHAAPLLVIDLLHVAAVMISRQIRLALACCCAGGVAGKTLRPSCMWAGCAHELAPQ